MAFRNVIISSRCKLDYSLNHLVIHIGVDLKRILLDEIKLIILNSNQVAITSILISECFKKKIRFIFCDEKHFPIGEISSYKNNHISYGKLKEQIGFFADKKDILWKKIIIEKIKNQRRVLLKKNIVEASNKLNEYLLDVKSGDCSNREGHAAKIYFNSLFGVSFSRDDGSDINKYLNYGYSTIISTISRAIKIAGYYTEIGIHHIGETNFYNLSYDLIEPLRPLVDDVVLNSDLSDLNFKKIISSLLEKEVVFNSKKTTLDVAIEEYVERIFLFLKGEKGSPLFIEYEL